MLREKSNNTSLTNWLKQRPAQSPSIAYNNENTMAEEEQLRRVLKQSHEDYQAQQKHDYDLASKSKPSTIFSDLPPIDDDDDDQYFQTISPRRVKREKRLSLKHTTSKRKRNNTNDTKTQVPAATKKTSTHARPLATTTRKTTQQYQPPNGSEMEPLSTVTGNGDSVSLASIKNEDSWEIRDDSEQTHILGSSAQVKDEAWEINDDSATPWDDDYNNSLTATRNRNTPPVTRQSIKANTVTSVVTDGAQQGDDLQQYVSAIRNRNTKAVIFPSSISTSTPATCQPKRPATQLDDVFHVFKNRTQTPVMQKTKDTSYNTPSVYQTAFDRHGTLTNHAVDTMEHHHSTSASSIRNPSGHSSTSVNETTSHGRQRSSASINQSEQQQLQDIDPWDNESDCSSIIDLCASDGGGVNDMDLTTSPDRAHSTGLINNSEDVDEFFDAIDADGEFYNNHLDTAYDDNDSILENDIDHHWATTMDDNDLAESSRNNNIQQADEDDDGYLSPLEGFTSLLEQSRTSDDYRPFFDQLTASAHPPSSSSSARQPAVSRRGGSSRSYTPRSSGSSRGRGGRGRYRKRWYKKK